MIQFYLNHLTIVGFRNKRRPHSRPGFPIKHDSNPYILKVTQQFRWSYFELGPSCDLRTKRVRSWWTAGVWRLGTRENSPGNSLFFPSPSHRLPLLPASFKESLISGNCPLFLALSRNLSSGRKIQWWRLSYRWGTTKVSVLFSLIKKQLKMSVDNGATGCCYRPILYD